MADVNSTDNNELLDFVIAIGRMRIMDKHFGEFPYSEKYQFQDEWALLAGGCIMLDKLLDYWYTPERMYDCAHNRTKNKS